MPSCIWKAEEYVPSTLCQCGDYTVLGHKLSELTKTSSVPHGMDLFEHITGEHRVSRSWHPGSTTLSSWRCCWQSTIPLQGLLPKDVNAILGPLRTVNIRWIFFRIVLQCGARIPNVEGDRLGDASLQAILRQTTAFLGIKQMWQMHRFLRSDGHRRQGVRSSFSSTGCEMQHLAIRGPHRAMSKRRDGALALAASLVGHWRNDSTRPG